MDFSNFLQQTYFKQSNHQLHLGIVHFYCWLHLLPSYSPKMLDSLVGKKKQKKTANQWDDVLCNVVKKTIVPLCELLVIYISLQFINVFSSNFYMGQSNFLPFHRLYHYQITHCLHKKLDSTPTEKTVFPGVCTA